MGAGSSFSPIYLTIRKSWSVSNYFKSSEDSCHYKLALLTNSTKKQALNPVIFVPCYKADRSCLNPDSAIFCDAQQR